MRTRRGHLRAAVVAGITIMMSALPVSLEASTFGVDEVLDLRTFAVRVPLDLSDDGKWIAYTLRTQREFRPFTYKGEVFSPTGVTADAIGASVWVTDIARGHSKRLVAAPWSSWSGTWSPDGKRLAFFSDQGGQASLWVWDRVQDSLRAASTRQAHPLFMFETPCWSRDGTKVLFKALPRTPARGAHGAVGPDADDRVRVFRSDDEQAPSSAESSSQYEDRLRSDLILVDVASGSTQVLAEEVRVAGYSLAPDGQSVAFMTLLGRESAKSQQWLFDIYVQSPLSAKPQKVASGVKRSYGMAVSWSPDGRRFAYTTSTPRVEGSIFHSGKGPRADNDLYVIDVRSREVRQLTTADHPSFGTNYGFPVWSRDGARLYARGGDELWEFKPAGGQSRRIAKSPLISAAEIISGGQPRVAWQTGSGEQLVLVGRDVSTMEALILDVRLADGAVRERRRERGSYGNAIFLADAATQSKRAAYVFQNARQPEVIRILADGESDRDGGSSSGSGIDQVVANPNPSLSRDQFGESRLIEWTSTSGEPLRGALLLPSGYQPGRRYPVLVEVYGGDMGSRYLHLFGLGDAGPLNKQLWATRGYAVLKPDTPLRMGTPLSDIAATVLPAVDKLIEIGIADERRLAVMGQSYGGYCVLALLVQTQRFHAAIASAGSANLISKYGTMSPDGTPASTGWAEEGQGRMGGTLWEHPQRYIDNSPIFGLDRVTTPLLLVHGDQDETVPATFSDEIFVGLSRLGRKAQLARYKYGEHTEGSFNAADSHDYFRRVEQWLAENLDRARR